MLQTLERFDFLKTVSVYEGVEKAVVRHAKMKAS